MYSSLTSAIPASYYIFLSSSENFRLTEVLPDADAPPKVSPVVLLDVHLEVHLEVLTYSDHTSVIPTHPRSI